MRITLYILENTKAQLIVDTVTTTNKQIAELVKKTYEDQGYIVNINEED